MTEPEAEQPGRFFRLLPVLIVAVVIVFHALSGIVWIVSNQVIQGSDEVDYFHSAQRFERYWPEDWSSPLTALRQITDYPAYAPAAPLSLILARIGGELFGKSLVTFRMISFLSYLLTMAMLFLIGKKLFGSWGGMLAVILFAGFPYAFIQSRFYNGFAVNSCLITASIALLLHSKYLTRWTAMAAFGIVAGLALLAERGTPPIILIGPAMAYGILSLIRHARTRPVMIAWALGFSAAAAGVALLIAGRYVFAYAVTAASHNQEMMTVPYYPDRTEFGYYLPKIARWITGEPVAALLLLASLWTLLIRPVGRRVLAAFVALYLLLHLTPIPMYAATPWLMAALVLSAFCLLGDEHWVVPAAWIVAPLLVFSSFATKDLEYIYSLIPAIALVGAAILAKSAQSPRVRPVLAVFVLFLFLVNTFQFLAVSFPRGPVREGYLNLPKIFRFANGHESYGPKPSTRREKAEQAIARLGIAGPGAVIYLPGTWDADQERGLPAEYESGGSQWMTELQIQIDFLTRGPDHFVFNLTGEKGKVLADRFGDGIFWFPMSEARRREFRREVGLENYAYVFSAMSPDMEDRLFDLLPIFAGERIGTLQLYPGRKVGLWVLGEGAEAAAEAAAKAMP